MSIAALQNHQRLQALMAMGALSPPRHGLVSSYDPATYTVKVKLQPSDIETGWLPIMTMQAGAGWGVYFAPAIGDLAAVVFQEGSVESGFCLGFLPNDDDKPPNVPTGEGLIKHKDGALLHFGPGGLVELVAPGGLHITADTLITGNLVVSGDITDQHGANSVTVAQHRIAYDAHKHTDVQSGSSSTGTTDHPV